MTLIEEELERLLNWKIIIVMTDGRKFRGRLIKFDSHALVIEEIYELSERLQWIKPIIYTTVAKASVDSSSVVEQSERGYLDQLIINTRHIIRIWPWEPKKIE
jgi:small nuclear ribonucleoprotein (snRNP)-like protein